MFRFKRGTDCALAAKSHFSGSPQANFLFGEAKRAVPERARTSRAKCRAYSLVTLRATNNLLLYDFLRIRPTINGKERGDVKS